MSYRVFTTETRGREPLRASRLEGGIAALQGVAGGALIALTLLALVLALSGCAAAPKARPGGVAAARAAAPQRAPAPRQAVDPALAALERAEDAARAAAIVGALAQIAGSFGGNGGGGYSQPQAFYTPAPQYAPPPIFNLSEPQAAQPTIWRPNGFQHLNH